MEFGKQNGGQLVPAVKSNLKPGDHIFGFKLGGLYSHHGIYAGDGQVIHFNGLVGDATLVPPTIVKCCIDCFGDTIYLYKYGVSWDEFRRSVHGTCCPYKSKPLKDALKTANDILKTGFGDYNLVTNNCEHFATFCRTCTKFSGQVFITHPHLEQRPNRELENIAAGNCTNMMILKAVN